MTLKIHHVQQSRVSDSDAAAFLRKAHELFEMVKRNKRSMPLILEELQLMLDGKFRRTC